MLLLLLLLALLIRVVILARLRHLLAERIILFLRGRRSFRLHTALGVSSKLVICLVPLRALILHLLRHERIGRGLLREGLLLRCGRQARSLLRSRQGFLRLRLSGWSLAGDRR